VTKAIDYVQQMSSDSVGKVSVAIGGGGTTFQIITEYTSLFILAGNALLVTGGLFLLSYKIQAKIKERWKKRGK
jgi:hypothetical protein